MSFNLPNLTDAAAEAQTVNTNRSDSCDLFVGRRLCTGNPRRAARPVALVRLHDSDHHSEERIQSTTFTQELGRS